MSDTIKKKKAPRRYKILLWLLIGGVIFGAWFLFGVNINFSSARPIDELEQARAKWHAQGMDDYQMSLSLGNFSHIGWLDITVINGQVNQVLDGSRALTEIPDWWSRYFKDYLPDDLARWSMDGLFDVAADHIQDKPALVPFGLCGRDNMDSPYNRYNVDFDSAQGYITRLQNTCQPEWNVGLGFLCELTIGECNSGIYINSLEPLSTPAQ